MVPCHPEGTGDRRKHFTRIEQIHSAEYRAPEQISTDNVIVVGSGSSGVQICRLLAESGRLKSLHLAVSNVVALPRHVLGIPTHRFSTSSVCSTGASIPGAAR